MSDFRVTPAMVRDQTAEKIKQAILSGFFTPGQRLVERELGEMCGVSRTSIREALRVLEGEKLIVNVPHRGPRVAVPSVEEAKQIYEVRAVLEALLGRWAAINASEIDIASLSLATDKFALACKGEDLLGMVSAADEYYLLLAQAAKQDIASELHKSLRTRISTLRATSMSRVGRGVKSVEEMRAIVQAIQSRDPEAAAKACELHVRMAAAAAEVILVDAVNPKKDIAKPAKKPSKTKSSSR